MKLADIIHHKTVLFTRPKENVDKCREGKKNGMIDEMR